MALRRLAEDLAKGRTERATTGHLLAAIASRPGAAADLLGERRLDAEVLLKAARVTTDDANDGVTRAIQRARELAARSQDREPGAIHLLFALCQERGAAAHRTLEQCGVDVTKLRTAAMQLAMGIAPERRHAPVRASLLPNPSRPTLPSPARASEPQATSARLATAPPKKDEETPRVAPRAMTTLPTTAPKQRPAPPAARASKKRSDAATDGPSPESRFALDPKLFPTLTAIGKNLTLAAARGELEAVVGREEESERTLDVLAKKRANSPCLVGAPGVGKTSVVRGVALRIANGEGLVSLDDRIVVEIEPSALLSGTGVRGALAERVAQIKAEAQRSGGRVVVFFDEMHALFADAADEGTTELKAALAKGELACNGATTEADYRRFFDNDPQLARRLTAVEILPRSSAEDAFLVLEHIALAFGAHHQVTYSTEERSCRGDRLEQPLCPRTGAPGSGDQHPRSRRSPRAEARARPRRP